MSPVNDIKLAKNACGAGYEVSLDANYNGTKMEAVVVAVPLTDGEPYSDE